MQERKNKQVLYPIGFSGIIAGVVLLLIDYYITEPKVMWSDPATNPYVLVFGIISLIVGMSIIIIKFLWR